MSAIKLDVSTEDIERAAQTLSAVAAFAEDMAKRARSWMDGVEAGEMDADEMWSALRILRDQADLLRDRSVKAGSEVDEQMSDLRRALGW